MATVLVIEDDLQVRRMVCSMLEDAGHRVWEAENGKQGIDLYVQHSHDVVITDIVMPEQEGLSTIMQLKKLHGDVKIIVMSGGGRIDSTEYLGYAVKLGVHYALQKPFAMDKLLQAITRLTGPSAPY
jgi:DNA-binding NtrC family response regulator